MTRLFVVLLAVAAVVLVPAGPVAAHGGEAPDATAYRVTVTAISPGLPGLTVRVVEAGTRLELVNDTGRPIEVLGYSGEPYLEVRPDGTYENVHSPAAYLNRTLAGTTDVPAGADPAAPPRWRRVSGSTTVRWHDQRAQWRGEDPPPAARADPARAHRLREWAVPLREQARQFEVRGTLDWVPPPRAWLWWAGAGLLAVLVFAAGFVATRSLPGRSLPGPSSPGRSSPGCPSPGRSFPGRLAAVGVRVSAALAGAVVLASAVTRTLDSGPPVVLFAAALAGFVTAAARSPFAHALGGAVLVVFAGLAEAGVLRAAVVPAAGPAWFARLAVVVALGAGAGVAAAGVRALRRSAELSEDRTKVEP